MFEIMTQCFFWFVAAMLSGCAAYYMILMMASFSRQKGLKNPKPTSTRPPKTKFLVAIPAHNEENVIKKTVASLTQQNYPKELFDIMVVADHCTDKTALYAKQAQAKVFERSHLPRGSKGLALNDLFSSIDLTPYDAVVIFDADSKVAPSFLSHFDKKFLEGSSCVQGNHVIINPESGPYSALTWAMFVSEIRLKCFGRSRLGLSSKNLGDAIAIRTDLIKSIGWGNGLADDAEVRSRVILKGHKIDYVHAAVSYGEATSDWQALTVQRTRWVAGTNHSNKSHRLKLLKKAIFDFDIVAFDAFIDSYLPSFSLLMLTSLSALTLSAFASLAGLLPPLLPAIFLGLLTYFTLVPPIAIWQDGAGFRKLRYLGSGPRYILFRTKLCVLSYFGNISSSWIPTRHGLSDK